MTKNTVDSIVFAPSMLAGGVKSLYSVCEWLKDVGRSSIVPCDDWKLASWFDHDCELYDYSYSPDILIYPEVYQPHIHGEKYHICFALGKNGLIEPHADLIVCRSHEISDWVKPQQPRIQSTLILPDIKRSVFEYDGRQKKDIICFITRSHKHPETAELLRNEYGNKVMEIVNFSEAEVAEAFKDAKAFVWRGDDREGSPRPPKEALVAGCVVVGLQSDLTAKYHTDFGIKCSTVDELIKMAGEALNMPMPTDQERSVVRDSKEAKQDWLALVERLTTSETLNRSRQTRLVRQFAADLRTALARKTPSLGGSQRTTECSVALVSGRQLAVERITTESSLRREEELALSQQTANRQDGVHALAAELGEQKQLVESLSLQLADRDNMFRAAEAQLADECETVQSLTSVLADKEQAQHALAAQARSGQQALQILAAQLAVKEAELERITNTIGWRLLSLYGRIKYPYLLPIYRLLGLVSRDRKPEGNGAPLSSGEPTND